MGSLGVEGSEKKKAMWLYPKLKGFNPSERWGHSACYSQGFLYVFGGCCGGLHFGDVLRLNLDTMGWTALASTGEKPGPRDSHSAAVVGQSMIVFGGTNGSKKVNDLHILDLAAKEWTRPVCTGAPPLPRESHTATLVGGGERLVIFGGSGEGEGNYLNDLHVLDLETMNWSSPAAKGDIPAPRDSHSAVAIGNRLFVYGGDCGDRYNGDVDVLDMDTLTWSRLCVQGSSPGVRAGHAAVNIGTKVYIIGGVGDKHYYNDVWVLDVTTCSWTQLDIGGQQPQGRFSHTAIVTDLDIAIYGGCGEDERPLNELLVLQLGAEHPNGRYNVSMCKIFGKHWNQEKRRPSREGNSDNMNERAREPESERRRSMTLNSDTLHPKRRRTTTAKAWDFESEQEEHSLSLSQSSSPSLSDQEPTTTRRASDSPSGSQGFNLFKKLSNAPPSTHRDSVNISQRTPIIECHSQPNIHMVRNLEHKLIDSGPVQNLIGAEVRGKVDGAFDSGYLMTATVKGKVFRGVLFSPGLGSVPRGPVLAQNHPMASAAAAQPFPNHHVDQRFRLFHHQPMKSVDPRPGHSFSQAHLARPFPVVRASPSKEPTSPRSDLQGVVLTLGGPGSSQH